MFKESNTFLVQLRGPFSTKDNLLQDIELEKTFDIHDSSTGNFQPITENRFIKKIGIQITPEASFEAQVKMPNTASHQIIIGHLGSDDYVFTIGATGILEMDDLRLTKDEISTIQFLQNENELTLVDLILDTDIIDSEGGK